VKREKECDGVAYEELLDTATAKRRLRRIVDAALTVEEYGRAHDRVVAAGEEQPSCRPGLRAGLADRAYAMEDAVRSLLADHLDTLNELRDAGALGRMVDEATGVYAKHDWDWRRILDEVIEGDGEELGIEPELLKRAAERAQDLDLALMPGDEESIGAEVTEMSGERRRFLVRGRPRPGDLARVSTEQLLGGGGAGVVAAMPVAVLSNCHHRDSGIAFRPEMIDLYGTNVAALAYVRENAYLHARTMDELGPSAFRGEDPATAIGVGILIVGLVFVGAGVVMLANGDPAGWAVLGFGLIFVGGGLCVALGPCAVAIGLGPVHITV
jgi:hypothetical protein